jgi:hypothetical protein
MPAPNEYLLCLYLGLMQEIKTRFGKYQDDARRHTPSWEAVQVAVAATLTPGIEQSIAVPTTEIERRNGRCGLVEPPPVRRTRHSN